MVLWPHRSPVSSDGGVQKVILGGIGAGFLLFVMAKITGDMSKAGMMAPMAAAAPPPAAAG
jgi:lipopolysaccharide export system permease protein